MLVSAFDCLTNQKVVEEYEMICDWLANRECLFPEESSKKIHVFKVRWEKRSDVHAEDKRTRKKSLQELKLLLKNFQYRKNKEVTISILTLYELLLHHCVSINSC